MKPETLKFNSPLDLEERNIYKAIGKEMSVSATPPPQPEASVIILSSKAPVS